MKKIIFQLLVLSFFANNIWATTYIVAENGGDYTTIQGAINIAVAGDTILVKEKSIPYFEEISFPKSGNATEGYIVLMAFPNETPIIDGSNISTNNNWRVGIIKIENKSYIKIIGFEIRNFVINNSDVFPAGIWIIGALNNVEIVNNKIYSIEQNATDVGAHGLAVYGTSSSASINNILIDNNEVYDCKLGWSEALVLNGNVEKFVVSNNIVHDNNNIAFDFIGHEEECPDPELDQARDGIVNDNIAYNIDSRGNPAYGDNANADGFYIDGGKNIIFERNIVYNCNIGFEIASEHGGKSTSGIIIRNNLIRNNSAVGIAFGGYDSERGSTNNCKILNNTFYKNNTENFDWGAEVAVQYYCDDNVFVNNIVFSNSGIIIVQNNTNTGSNNLFNNNLYFSDGNPIWQWNNSTYSNFNDYKNSLNHENNSLFTNPLLVNPTGDNPSLQVSSVAIDNGIVIEQTENGDFDFFSKPRIVNNKIDIGAVECQTVTSVEKFNIIDKNNFHLYQAYPNPFNPSTVIKYQIATNVNSESLLVKLTVYDILGREVATLVNMQQKAGNYEITFNAENLLSGIYFYKLQSGNFTSTKKIMLLK
jgi:hypothetical protein